jgi:hypothetical protein
MADPLLDSPHFRFEQVTQVVKPLVDRHVRIVKAPVHIAGALVRIVKALIDRVFQIVNPAILKIDAEQVSANNYGSLTPLRQLIHIA